MLHPYFDFPFHRIGERIGMLALLVGFLAVARRCGLADRVSLGYGLARRAFLREMGVGPLIGAVTMLGVVAIMGAFGLLDWTRLGLMRGGSLPKLIVLRALKRAGGGVDRGDFSARRHAHRHRGESGTRAAVLLTALLYAATHFFASYHIVPATGHAVERRGAARRHAARLRRTRRGLSMRSSRCSRWAWCSAACGSTTGNIAACIGLHAGWVWVMLIDA